MKAEHLNIDSLQGKKLYFASDFHLGAPDYQTSRAREDRIVSWLSSIEEDAHSIFLMGDIFDFWFEYKEAIPKGFVRIQGKLAQLTDKGIGVYLFSGNHDMWMFDYFPTELNIPVIRDFLLVQVGSKKLLLAHGDGLGPGDKTYKILKKIFRNPVCQWLFARIHPNAGIGLAKFWSGKSRISNNKKKVEDTFRGESEYLLQFCRETEKQEHFDYYIFGHRHLPLELEINKNSYYFNLGEWVTKSTYGVYDGSSFTLKSYDG